MRPFLLIIDGPPGSGKTSVAQLIHQKHPKTALLGHDRVVSLISGFRRDERNNKKVRIIGLAAAEAFLKCNMNVIVEQPFSVETIDKYQRLGKKLKAKTVTIQLATPRDISLRRIDKRNQEPAVWHKPRIARPRLLRNLRNYEDRPAIKAHVVDSCNQSVDQVAAEIERCLHRRGNTPGT